MAQTSSDGFVTVSDVSIELHISFPLAMEYLKVRGGCDQPEPTSTDYGALILDLSASQVAEELGDLCRDETFEGLSFYPNAFPSFT